MSHLSSATTSPRRPWFAVSNGSMPAGVGWYSNTRSMCEWSRLNVYNRPHPTLLPLSSGATNPSASHIPSLLYQCNAPDNDGAFINFKSAYRRS
jgi:hypothetical protein